jgi:hypothetical protein
MHRLETSTAQVDAALRYLLDKGANIAGPVREINHFGLKRISLEKRPIQPQKSPREHFQDAMKKLLAR